MSHLLMRVAVEHLRHHETGSASRPQSSRRRPPCLLDLGLFRHNIENSGGPASHRGHGQIPVDAARHDTAVGAGVLSEQIRGARPGVVVAGVRVRSHTGDLASAPEARSSRNAARTAGRSLRRPVGRYRFGLLTSKEYGPAVLAPDPLRTCTT
jgi:hypothetical protein